VTLVKTFFVGL